MAEQLVESEIVEQLVLDGMAVAHILAAAADHSDSAKTRIGLLEIAEGSTGDRGTTAFDTLLGIQLSIRLAAEVELVIEDELEMVDEIR